MSGPTPVETDRGFIGLPPDLQRAVIDWCIANRKTVYERDGKVYDVPKLIQITYRCSDDGCNEIVPARFFRTDVINGRVNTTRLCPECNGKMYISHKTAVLDYYLGKKKKRKLKGIEKYIAHLVQDGKEEWGSVTERSDEL